MLLACIFALFDPFSEFVQIFRLKIAQIFKLIHSVKVLYRYVNVLINQDCFWNDFSFNLLDHFSAYLNSFLQLLLFVKIL